jgi:dihydrofolate synthase/folylpolyglutamate synthase
VNLAVLEVGLGGRLDATNVVRPRISIVTNIALDHERHLGPDLAAIAREKAGIFKPGVPALIGDSGPPEVRSVLEEVAGARGAPLVRLGDESRWGIRARDERRTVFDYESDCGLLDGLALPVRGDHFVADAALALRAWERVQGPIDPAVARAALARAIPAGRMEWRVIGDVRVLFDVAHNPAAIDRLVENLRGAAPRRWTFVAGILADKRWPEMLDALVAIAPRGWLCGLATANSGRELSAAATAGALASRPHVSWAESVSEGLAAARDRVVAGDADAILVTGSFHTVGEALVALGVARADEPYARAGPAGGSKSAPGLRAGAATSAAPGGTA